MAFLEQLANRQPGMPRKPEVPGAPPTVSRPADKVNPPAAASGPIGRPSHPPPAFPGGAGRPMPGVRPASPAATPPTSRPAPGASARPRQPAQSGVTPQPEQAPGALGLGQPLQHVLDRVPSPAEMASFPPDVEVMTPYGAMNRDGSIKLSPEGEAKYKEAVVARRKKLGPHPFAGDPNAPAMDVRLGGRMFNPFLGRWVEAD